MRHAFDLVQNRPKDAVQTNTLKPANMQDFSQSESKLAKNATIKILYDFHDFSILACLDHATVIWSMQTGIWTTLGSIVHSWELQV